MKPKYYLVTDGDEYAVQRVTAGWWPFNSKRVSFLSSTGIWWFGNYALGCYCWHTKKEAEKLIARLQLSEVSK